VDVVLVLINAGEMIVYFVPVEAIVREGQRLRDVVPGKVSAVGEASQDGAVAPAGG